MRALVAIFLGGALIMLLATAPLRLALEFALPDGSAFSAAEVSGPVWGGTARGARFGAASLGDARLGLNPLSLATGAPRLAFSAEGAATGSGTAILGAARWGLDEATLAIPLAALPLGANLSGRLWLDQASFLIRDGACVRAAGAARTDLLQENAQALLWQGPPLEGELACAEDGALAAALRGADARASVVATLSLYGDGRFALDTRVTPSDPGLAQALPLAGFAAGPEGFSQRIEGRFGA